MKKSTLNTTLSVAGFFALVLIVSSGMVLEFVLPRGAGKVIHDKGDPLRGMRPEILGLTRQHWSDFHLAAGLLLIAILAALVYTHWGRVKASLWGQPGRAKPRRRRLLVIFAAVVALLLLFAPWIATVEIDGFSVRTRKDLFLEHWRGGERGQ